VTGDEDAPSATDEWKFAGTAGSQETGKGDIKGD
jgi:hypothetical protein